MGCSSCSLSARFASTTVSRTGAAVGFSHAVVGEGLVGVASLVGPGLSPRPVLPSPYVVKNVPALELTPELEGHICKKA